MYRILVYCMIVACLVPAGLGQPQFNFTRSRYSSRHQSSTITPPTTDTDTQTDAIDPISLTTPFSIEIEIDQDLNNEEPTARSEEISNKSVFSAKDLDSESNFPIDEPATPPPKTNGISGESAVAASDTSNNTDSIERNLQTHNSAAVPVVFNTVISDVSGCGRRINDDIPWIAVLEHTNPNSRRGRKTLSKGVLISSQHVLTTVSSIHNSNPFWIVTKVRLGDTPTWGEHNINRTTSSMVSIDVEQIFQHHRKDIAVIKLAKPVNSTQSISPICLPDHDNYNYRELHLHMCKRKSSHATPSAPYVYSVPVTPLSPQDCSIMFQRKKARYTLDEFCAWDEVGDTCTGDLGGPLVADVNGRSVLIGLNSYISVKEEFNADDYPGIYTRVGAHLQWIDRVLTL